MKGLFGAIALIVAAVALLEVGPTMAVANAEMGLPVWFLLACGVGVVLIIVGHGLSVESLLIALMFVVVMLWFNGTDYAPRSGDVNPCVDYGVAIERDGKCVGGIKKP